MVVTERVALFGYDAVEVDKVVNKLNAEFEKQKQALDDEIKELKSELESLGEQIEYHKNNKQVVVKKRVINGATDSEQKDQKEMMKLLYDAHINATEKVLKMQKNINMTLEKRKSLILIREKKANEMKNDLQNLIEYVDSIAKEY